MKSIQLNKLSLLSAFTFFLVSSTAISQNEIIGNGAKGFELFQTNCTACHQVDGTFIGPQIRGVLERVETEGGVGREWLHSWIKDNKSLRQSGDAYALKVYEQYNKQEMLPFPNLTEQDIDDILVYSQNPEEGEIAYLEIKKAEDEKKAADKLLTQAAKGNIPLGIVLSGLLIWFVLLIWMSVRIGELKNITNSKKLT